MPPLNAPSSPEQSPTKIRANNPCIPAPDGQGYQLEPESTPKKLPKKTTNQKRQTTKKKTLKRESCLQDWGQTMLLVLFVDSFEVPTQMEEPNFALPFPHLRNLKKMFIAITRIVLLTSGEAMNV